MGSGNKGFGAVLGGAAGFALGGPAGASAGMAIGGGLESALSPGESYNGPTYQKLDKGLVDRLAAEASGQTVTAAELQLKQNLDKSLANQLALIKSQKAKNPALQARQIARMAAEQSQQANAQAATLAVQERQNAYQNYLRALDFNNSVDNKNYMQKYAFDQQENARKGAAFNTIAQGAMMATNASQSTPATKANSAKMDKINADLAANPLKSLSVNQPQEYNPYTLGVNQPQEYNPYTLGVNQTVSDERQKDLVKAETMQGSVPIQMQQANAIQKPGGNANVNVVNPENATTAPEGSTAQVNADIQTGQQSLAKGLQFEDLQYQTPGTSVGATLTPEQLKQAKQAYAGFQSNFAISSGSTANMSPAEEAAFRKKQYDANLNVSEGDKGFQDFLKSDLSRIYNKQNNGVDMSFADLMQKNQKDFAERNQKLEGVNKGIDAERAARAALYYTGNAQTNAQDLAKIYENRRAYTNWLKQNNVVVSDENKKSGVRLAEQSKVNSGVQTMASKEQSFNPKDFLDKLQAVSFEYKKSAQGMPGVSDGRKLGVLAQDVEKAGPVGQSMVKTDMATGTKMLDIPTGFSAVLASAAQMNERLNQLERLYAKKKGG